MECGWGYLLRDYIWRVGFFCIKMKMNIRNLVELEE